MHRVTFMGKYHMALDHHNVPRHSPSGQRLTYEERVQWLAEKAEPMPAPFNQTGSLALEPRTPLAMATLSSI